MNSKDDVAIPEPQAEMIKNTAATIRRARRPYLSASVPAKNAPTAQPSSMEDTLKPVPMESELKATRKPSTVPLITPLSKPKRKPPMVAMQLIRIIKELLACVGEEDSFMVIPGYCNYAFVPGLAWYCRGSRLAQGVTLAQ